MIRTILLIVALLVTTFTAAPRLAKADDDPPCAAEAKAVAKMKKRDPALQYPKDADAVAHVEAGKRAFGVGQYDTAIESYTAAGLADEAPLILYNLGQTYRAAKDYERAIRQYRLFLERGKPGEKVRALVECHIATMEAESAHAASTAPPTGPAPEPAGPAATDPSTASSSPDEALPLDTPSDPEATPRSRWTGTRKLALGVGAAGVVALVAGAVFAVQTQGLKDDAAGICPSSPCDNAEQANALSDRADTRATLTNISLGAGAALVAGAVVLWFVGAPADSTSESDDVAFVPQLSSTYAGIGFNGRF